MAVEGFPGKPGTGVEGLLASPGRNHTPPTHSPALSDLIRAREFDRLGLTPVLDVARDLRWG